MLLDPFLNLAIFIIWWWMALFAMLPIGVKSLEEAGEKAPGHDQGAPHITGLKKKAVYAAIAAVFLWAITAAFIAINPFGLGPGGSL
jgi:predicted secreted protein